MITYQSESLMIFQSELYQTNSSVLVTQDLVLLTDPGFLPSELQAIRTFLDEVKGERPVYVFFTHSDWDHIVGYGAFKDCTTIAGDIFAEQTDQAKAVEINASLDDEFYIIRSYDIEYPRVDMILRKEGEALTVGQTVLTFYSAAGHNPDGWMCMVGQGEMLITGDYLSDIEFPFVFHTYAAYRNTLSKLRGLSNTCPNLLLVPSHGSVTDRQEEIRHRLDVSEAYLQLTEELLEQPDEARLEDFMKDQNYKFKRTLARRHETNLNLLIQEKI